MNLLAAGLQEYLLSLHPGRDAALSAMEELAAERRFPIIGPLVGTLCHVLARTIGARRVLELGSGFGYSARWFALAGARVVLTEGDPDNVALARRHLAGLDCEFHEGDAFETLPRLDGSFDIVFCDVEKADYPRAWKAALPRLRPGGLFITDNTLWSGRVLDREPDEHTRGVLEYNRLAFSTPGVVSTLIPLRDGVTVSVRL